MTNVTEFEVKSGYSRDKRKYIVRYMTFSEALNAKDHINVLDGDGNLREVKVNGRVKTWKTRPNDCRIPYKYGMYDYGHITFMNGHIFSFPSPVVIIREL
jgi:hypothetical protein